MSIVTAHNNTTSYKEVVDFRVSFACSSLTPIMATSWYPRYYGQLSTHLVNMAHFVCHFWGLIVSTWRLGEIISEDSG